MEWRFFDRFKGLDRAFGQYTITTEKGPKKKGKAFTVAAPLTVDQWKDHLEGKKGLGVVPIRDDNCCSWGAVDVDVYDLDLVALAKMVAEWPVVVCRTKSGGAHVYLFTTEPIRVVDLRKKLSDIATAIGHPNSEIFPKQEEIGPADTGNWINMPYFDHAVTSRYAIDPKTGAALSAEEFLELADEKAISDSDLRAWYPPERDDFSDAPPCLQELVNTGFPKGSRNHALFSLGVYFQKKYPDDWETKIVEANQKWMDGTWNEIQGIVRSLTKKEYTYKCSDQPLCNVCNKEECRRRKFGLGEEKETLSERKSKRPCPLDEVDLPVKCFEPPDGSYDNPYWEFRMRGKVLRITMDMLETQRKFLREMLRVFHQKYSPVNEDRWDKLLNKILKEAERVEMPADAGPEGQLWGHIEEFCTGRVQAKDRGEIILGRPLLEDDRHWFRSGDLMKFLAQRRFKDFSESEIWQILNKANAKHKKTTIKGRCVSLWGIEKFETQDEGFDIPDIQAPEEF